MKGLKRLNEIRENPDWIHRDIFRILRKEDIWFAAYENVKGNKGALTPGVTKDTLDETSIGKLRLLQQDVLEERYRFKPVKQTWIPKANGKGLPTSFALKFDDKIVQEVIRMVLEAVYEPIFDERSFGFRSGKGVHDALKYVEEEFRWVDWVIKGDIQNAYPTIDHSILRLLLSRKIDDPRFLRLINKSLKCGVYKNPQTVYSKLGVPQGSIVSPILANIYFHELDQWVNQKRKEYFSPKSTKRNQIYKKLQYQIKKASEKLDQTDPTSIEARNMLREMKGLIAQRNQTPSLLDPGVQVRYVRYADDWMIGVKGPCSLAKQLREEVDEFFETKLRQTLDPEKTKVINLRAGKVNFLGYDIFLPRNIKLVKYKRKGAKQTMRRQSPTLRFHLPVKKVLQRLNERGYITYTNNRWRPVSKSDYTPLDDEIIVRHFSSVWRGIRNFYSGTTNWSHLQYIHYLLHMSCAMSLGHRHRVSSRKIFQKHGKRLEIIDQSGETPKILAYFPYHTNWKVSDRKWQTAKTFRDPFTIYANRVSRSSLNKPCCSCQRMAKVEMHHLKDVRKKGVPCRNGAFKSKTSTPISCFASCHLAVHAVCEPEACAVCEASMMEFD
jgi:group II intron reverse transcriptase/maturase